MEKQMDVKGFLYILLVFTLIKTNAMANIKEITSIKEAGIFLEKTDEDTLVIFDVDYVLIQPTDPAFHMNNILKYKELWKNIVTGLSRSEKDRLSTLVGTEGGSVIIEKDMVSVIKNLIRNEIKVIALTGILTESLHKIPDIDEWRYTTLKKFGVDFSKSFPHLKKITFSVPPSYHGSYPLFNRGILYSNGDASREEKGKALKSFLTLIKEKSNWVPSLIIFIDDREHNLKDIEKLCANFNPSILFTGLLYKGAQNFNYTPISENSFRQKWKEMVRKTKRSELSSENK